VCPLLSFSAHAHENLSRLIIMTGR
jgi:hypothetical protein